MSLILTLAPLFFGGRDLTSHDGTRHGSRGVDDARPADRVDAGPSAVARAAVDPANAADAAELAIVAGVRSGDPRAMESLVVRYADALVRFAMALTRSRAVADELAYDALSRVWERREQLRTDRSLAPYLFTTVRNLAAHATARARVRDRHVSEAMQEAKQIATADPHTVAAPAPDELLARDDAAAESAALIAALETAVAVLPERRRVALELRFGQGMTYPAIGEVLGLSDKAAQQLILRTIHALRRTLVPRR